jgi:large subunit ribosomal protein LX
MSETASETDASFVVRGRYQARDGWQEFEKEVRAPNQDVAIERTYADIGSQHALKRTRIDVYGVSA